LRSSPAFAERGGSLSTFLRINIRRFDYIPVSALSHAAASLVAVVRADAAGSDRRLRMQSIRRFDYPASPLSQRVRRQLVGLRGGTLGERHGSIRRLTHEHPPF
jgi:hypothetical protein